MQTEGSPEARAPFGNWKAGLALIFVGGFFASVATGHWSHGFGFSVITLIVIAWVQRKTWLAALRSKK